MRDPSILEEFSEMLKEHGHTPQSLGYNGKPSQELCFAQASKLFDPCKGVVDVLSVHDVGCGLADFKTWLDDHQFATRYSGNDINPDMVEEARRLHPEADIYQGTTIVPANFITAITTFNERYTLEEALEILSEMYSMCSVGVGMDFFTTYVDFKDKKVLYTDPSEVLTYCISNLSRHVVINHALPTYRYFVYIYRPEFIKSLYGDTSRFFGRWNE